MHAYSLLHHHSPTLQFIGARYFSLLLFGLENGPRGKASLHLVPSGDKVDGGFLGQGLQISIRIGQI